VPLQQLLPLLGRKLLRRRRLLEVAAAIAAVPAWLPGATTTRLPCSSTERLSGRVLAVAAAATATTVRPSNPCAIATAVRGVGVGRRTQQPAQSQPKRLLLRE
jgi:phosphate/sulfate permease